MTSSERNFESELISDGKNRYLTISDKVYNKTDSSFFKATLKPGEVISENIGQGLLCTIPTVLPVSDNSVSPKADKNNYDLLMMALKNVQLKDSEVIALPTRIANVIIVWNSIRHFYPYFEDLNLNWELQFEKALEKSFTDIERSDHLRTLELLLAPLQDGHVSVRMLRNPKRYYPDFYSQIIEGKLYIVSAGSNKSLNAGDEIIEIDNVTVAQALDEEKKYVSSGNVDLINERIIKRALVREKGEKIYLFI